MINETRERFIKSVAEKVAMDRVVEAHFFPSIRQGHIETGVAVIAARNTVAGEERTEVYTASYRWTRKGPDRGKWVVDVVSEADAPLGTVETVVRGVQERAGEALDAHRMTGEELLAIAPAPEKAEAVVTPHSPEPAASAATTPEPITDTPGVLGEAGH